MLLKNLAFTWFVFSSFVWGHSGGLDSQGGHTDQSTGAYHCHWKTCVSISSTTDPLKPVTSSDKYDRDDWPHWSDFDSDCMNTRHEMLLAQADGDVKLSPDACYVSTGTWIDPFSGKTFHRASDLDVDHIIPLKWAHEHGGASWSTDEKELFANDPKNLLVVDDGLNQSKGAQGPTEWLPPNHTYRCDYLFQWEFLLTHYAGLSMTSAENRQFQRMLSACRD